MLTKFRYRLEPSSVESQFRAEGLNRDTGVAAGLMLFAILFHLISFPTDLERLGGSENLYVLWVVRAASAAIALGSLFLIRRTPGVAFFDNVVFSWAALLLMGIVLENALLPADYTTHVAWDVFLALGVYAVVPLPLNRQAILASIITVGDIAIVILHRYCSEIAGPSTTHRRDECSENS